MNERTLAVWVRGLVEGDKAMRVALDTEVEVNGEVVLLSSVPEGSVAYLSIVSMEAQERLVAVRRLPSSESPTFVDERELTVVFRGPGLPSTEELASDLSRVAGLLSLTLGSEVEIRGGEEVLLLLREDDLLAGDRPASEGDAPSPDLVALRARAEKVLGDLLAMEERQGRKRGGIAVWSAKLRLEAWLRDPETIPSALYELSLTVIKEHLERMGREIEKEATFLLLLTSQEPVRELLRRADLVETPPTKSQTAARKLLVSWLSDPEGISGAFLKLSISVITDYVGEGMLDPTFKSREEAEAAIADAEVELARLDALYHEEFEAHLRAGKEYMNLHGPKIPRGREKDPNDPQLGVMIRANKAMRDLEAQRDALYGRIDGADDFLGTLSPGRLRTFKPGRGSRERT